MSIGSDSKTTKDVFISAYFVNMDMADECSRKLGVDVHQVGGYFIPSTNEIVVIICVYDDSIEDALKEADIRSTIERELIHAFDHTSKSNKRVNQKSVPGVAEDFLASCLYLGCASKSDIAGILQSGITIDSFKASSINSICMVLYKLFTITEFNAHQASDLKELHKINIKRSNDVRKALLKDIITDTTITSNIISHSLSITPEECPELWKIIGNVLVYIGYNLRNKSPKAVYKFYKETSHKLFLKYTSKKYKTQVKSIISLREKNNIKDRLIKSITDDTFEKGLSFWFSPVGDSNSYLCRIKSKNNKVILLINNKPAKIYGNADNMLKRVLDSINSSSSKFDFAIDNLVDIIVQSIERNFNSIDYDPVYDITIPQDEDQIKATNTVNRFADLDWD